MSAAVVPEIESPAPRKGRLTEAGRRKLSLLLKRRHREAKRRGVPLNARKKVHKKKRAPWGSKTRHGVKLSQGTTVAVAAQVHPAPAQNGHHQNGSDHNGNITRDEVSNETLAYALGHIEARLERISASQGIPAGVLADRLGKALSRSQNR